MFRTDAAPRSVNGRPADGKKWVTIPINGYEICRAARAQGLDVPILMVTAKGQEQDVVLGLNLGADDYVVKPFRAAERIARARAFLRRRSGERAVSRFGDFVLDSRARTLSHNGKPSDLTAREFKLLAYFASRPGCALARDTILNAVWGSAVLVTPRSRRYASGEGRARRTPSDLHPDDP